MTLYPLLDLRLAKPQAIRREPAAPPTPTPQHRLGTQASKLRDLARREEPIGHASSSLGSNACGWGIPVRDDDIDTLIDLLHRVGRAEDLELAMRLKRGVSLGTTLLALSGDERDLLLNVLDHPPKGLIELRAGLARNRR